VVHRDQLVLTCLRLNNMGRHQRAQLDPELLSHSFDSDAISNLGLWGHRADAMQVETLIDPQPELSCLTTHCFSGECGDPSP